MIMYCLFYLLFYNFSVMYGTKIGAVNNVAATFGGYPNSKINDVWTEWTENAAIASKGLNDSPERVPEVMYTHIRTRGSCTDLPATNSPALQVPLLIPICIHIVIVNVLLIALY
jgi:hypothetical protein